MLTRKSIAVVCAIIIAIGFLSVSLSHKQKSRSKAVEMVAQLYSNEMSRFDQILKRYPTYFYDSSYELRKSRYEELARQMKKVECLFYYYHPQIALEQFFRPGKLEKREMGPPFPDSWIISGPFGIETDSETHKMKPGQIAFTKMFISRAANNY